MSNGQGCTCNAWAANECACGADWTPQEVYDLRAENNRLKAENKLYAAEMSAAKEDGFYSAQELFMAYQNAEEELAEAKKCKSNEDLQDVVSKALRNAWHLGQTYWQQADSEYYSQNKRAEETFSKFDALVDETLQAMKGK